MVPLLQLLLLLLEGWIATRAGLGLQVATVCGGARPNVRGGPSTPWYHAHLLLLLQKVLASGSIIIGLGWPRLLLLRLLMELRR